MLKFYVVLAMLFSKPVAATTSSLTNELGLIDDFFGATSEYLGGLVAAHRSHKVLDAIQEFKRLFLLFFDLIDW